MNNDKEGYVVITVLTFIIAIIVCIIINSVKTRLIVYEYSKNGELGTSVKCYINNKDQCMCLIDNQFEYVDSYYKK